MTSITPMGAYSNHLSLVRTLNERQTTVDTLTQQLATGKKSVDLKPFGADTERLLKLRTELVERQAYTTSIDTAMPRLQAADLVLDRLTDVASDLANVALMPLNPGPVAVSTPTNTDDQTFAISVGESRSAFTMEATYTVTAMPSATGSNGSFDILINDGLGGRASATININEVPPEDGYNHTFKMVGGPGDGAVVNLNLDQLQGPGTSSFSVRWPDVSSLRERTIAYMTEVRNLLNERVGDRYLFAGSRHGTPPVRDVTESVQVTQVTLDGAVRLPSGGDIYRLTIDDETVFYTTDGTEADLSDVAKGLQAEVEALSPALPVTITEEDGMLTISGNSVGQTFTVDAAVSKPAETINAVTVGSANQPTVPLPSYPMPAATIAQVDTVEFVGPLIDIGDEYKVTIAVGDPDDPVNADYYNNNPTAPRDLPVYQEYTYSVTVNADNRVNNDPFTGAPLTNIDDIAAALTARIQADPPPLFGSEVVVAANPGAPSGTITLTATPASNIPFTTTAEANNGNIPNTIQIATLPAEAAPVQIPTADTLEPNLPFYDTEFTPTIERDKAWDKARVTIDTSLEVEYGMTSTDPAFQKLIKGLRYARAAVENPGAYRDNVEIARDLFNQAKDEMRSLSGRNASDLRTLELTREAHRTTSASVRDQIADIEGIDQTEVSVSLSAAMTTLEAVYTVSARSQRLQLINFLT